MNSTTIAWLALIHRVGRGNASGIALAETTSAGAFLFEVHVGRVRKLEIYWNRDRAFADRGLAPDTD